MNSYGTYASEETKIGNIAGIDLYRYVFSTSSLSGNHYENTLPFSFSGVTKIDGIAVRDTGMIFPINDPLGSNANLSCYIANGKFVLDYGTSLTLSSITIVIEYFK